MNNTALSKLYSHCPDGANADDANADDAILTNTGSEGVCNARKTRESGQNRHHTEDFDGTLLVHACVLPSTPVWRRIESP